jgi:hypothetical protein
MQLTAQKSIDAGYGKVCLRKIGSETEANNRGEGNNDIYVPYDGGDIWIKREDNNQITTNIIKKATKHSPTGVNFGYGGSGAADFALNVMLMFAQVDSANMLYQTFKWKFVAVKTEDEATLVIKKSDIINFIKENGGSLL